MSRIPRSGVVSVALVVLAAVLATAGGAALYLREEVVAPTPFADRATDALERDEVRSVVAREIVVQLIDRGSTDLISARPVLEQVVDFVVASPAFRRILRASARQTAQLLFQRDSGDVSIAVLDAGAVVLSALRSVAPDVAREVPADFDAQLLELRTSSVAAGTLRFAERVRFLGLLLPALALLLFTAGVLVAPDRRVALTRAGIALGTGCAMLVVALVVLEAAVLSGLHGEDELTDEDVRAAVAGVLDAYLGDLVTWAIVVGALSLLVASASASLLRPYSADRGLERLRALLRPPERRGWRAVHGGILVAAGAVIALEPELALRVGAVAAGAAVVYFGAAEILSAIQPAAPGEERAARRRLWPALAAGGATVLAAGVALVLLLDDGGEGPAAAVGPVRACNGYAELCDRRLDQVVFAGTHNAMSAADTRGWLLANQRRAIPRQLRDGIRLLLIDPHYGVRDRTGKVRTDLAAEPPGLNRVGNRLSPEATAALGRVGGQVGLGDLRGGRREVWLCHSVCELGATRMVDALRDVRVFLERNPGEVVILMSEDYVSERDLDRAYRQAGLAPYRAELERSEPLPTLRQLIDAGTRLVVFTEREPSGQYAWNHEAFSYIQDTPLGATRASAFRCDRNRGDASSPLLMINNWIDRFPPPLSANRAILKRRFVERRVRRCERERGMRANLVASDFYDQGDLVGAVRRLNGFGERPPAPTR